MNTKNPSNVKFSELKQGDAFMAGAGGMVYFKLSPRRFFNILEIHTVKSTDFEVLNMEYNCHTDGGLSKRKILQIAKKAKETMPAGKLPKFPITTKSP